MPLNFRSQLLSIGAFSGNTLSKHSATTRSFSRRDFLKTTAIGTAALAMPLIIPSRLLGADAPSNRIRASQVGCGRIGDGSRHAGRATGMADTVAVCDLDSKRAGSDDYAGKDINLQKPLK